MYHPFHLGVPLSHPLYAASLWLPLHNPSVGSYPVSPLQLIAFVDVLSESNAFRVVHPWATIVDGPDLPYFGPTCLFLLGGLLSPLLLLSWTHSPFCLFWTPFECGI